MLTKGTAEAMANVYMETSRFYNQECVYRSDIEQIVKNYDVVAGNYLKRVRDIITKGSSN